MKLVSTEGLWEHQKNYVEKFALVPEHIQLWEPRTGKTRASCKGFIRAILEANVFRILITGPKTGCQEVWADDEVPRALAELPENIQSEIITLLDIPKKDRLQILQGLVEERSYRLRNGLPPKVEVIIVNRDVLKDLEKELIRWNPQYFIIDELHKFKHSGSARSRTAFKIGKIARYRRGLTGTPAARSYSDIYGQWKVISPSTFGTSRRDFETRYCIFPPTQWRTKPVGYQNLDELKEKAFSIATIQFRKDCFDIPDIQNIVREISLPNSARDVYNNIVRQHILELGTTKVPMTHTLSRMMQLRQIACGYARYDEEEGRETEWLHTVKIESVAEQIEEIIDSGAKVNVFHTFHPEGYALQNYLKYRDIRAEIINGKVTGAERSKHISNFQRGSLNCVVVQEETASEGISLSAADYTIFLSQGLSPDTHKQACDRNFKPQNLERSIKLVRIYPLMKNTVEISLYNSIKQELSLERKLLQGVTPDSFSKMAYGVLD